MLWLLLSSRVLQAGSAQTALCFRLVAPMFSHSKGAVQLALYFQLAVSFSGRSNNEVTIGSHADMH